MIIRPYWLEKINEAWQKRPIVWLAGVRRVGKTTLASMIPDSVYLNCDLPSDARKLDDPELFFRSKKRNTIVILDEVHRLADRAACWKWRLIRFPISECWPQGHQRWLQPKNLGMPWQGGKRPFICFQSCGLNARKSLALRTLTGAYCPGITEPYEWRSQGLIIRATGCEELL